MKNNTTPMRAIAGFTGFCAAAMLAASAWAAGLHEEGFLLESAACLLGHDELSAQLWAVGC